MPDSISAARAENEKRKKSGKSMDSGQRAIAFAREASRYMALDLLLLHVSRFSSFADYFIICSGKSSRQVQGIAENVESGLRDIGIKPLGVEGKREGHWVLMDYGDVIIHIFYEPVRSFYDLESLWSDASRLEWEESPAEDIPITNKGSPQMFLSIFCPKRLRAAAAVTALVLALAVSLPYGTANAMNLGEEKEVGRKVLELIRKHMRLINDGEVLTYIRGVGNRIAGEVGSTTYQYQFFVVDESVPNAFAIPGGYIFIYRGLIEMMSSEGELASIFAHELAHIQARHIHRKMDEAKLLSVASLVGVIGAIFLGGGSAAGPALAAGSVAASQSAALAYSRAYEMEADQLGFRYFCSAGYQPNDMCSIMHKMDQIKWTGSSKIPSYLSTHPALGERVLYLDEMVKTQKISTSKPQKAAVGDFNLLQAALIADHAEQAKAYERFRSGIENGDTAAIFGMGRLYLHQGKVAEALAKLQETSRLIQSPFVLSSLGAVYHRLGRLQEAKRTFESALILDPSASIVHYRLALVLQEMGQKNEAIDHLMQIEELAPMFPEVDYQLGVLLGQNNRLGLAHFHLGRYYEHQLKWDLAIMHYKKAKTFIMDSPARIEDITAALKQLEKNKKDSPIKSKK